MRRRGWRAGSDQRQPRALGGRRRRAGVGVGPPEGAVPASLRKDRRREQTEFEALHVYRVGPTWTADPTPPPVM
jgi:hypothetical protein